jgi:hypothetical protein
MSLFSNIQRVIYLRSVCIVYSVLHLRSMYNKSIQQYTWDQCIMSLFSTILRSVCKISIQSYNEISSYILFICHQVIVLVRLSNSFSWTESLNFCNHLVFVLIYVQRLEDGKNFTDSSTVPHSTVPLSPALPLFFHWSLFPTEGTRQIISYYANL